MGASELLDSLVGVIYYACNSLSGEKYKYSHSFNENTDTAEEKYEEKYNWPGSMVGVINFSPNSLSGNRQLIHRRHKFT